MIRTLFMWLLLMAACGDDANPSDETLCHQKGGVWVYHYKARNICLRREAVLMYDE